MMPATEAGGGIDVPDRAHVTTDASSSEKERVREEALRSLTTSAVSNIPGVDFASVTLYGTDHALQTVAATDPLAEQMDAIQYELREGPCFAAVQDDRFVLVNDVAATREFARYGERAAQLGVRAQAAIQLVQNGQRAGLNLYALEAGAFDRSTVMLAELFATHAAALLDYAGQVGQLSDALHTRTDIGTAVGILMERYGIDRNRAFAFLVRNSNNRNLKLRVLAQHVIDGTFESTSDEDSGSRTWP